MSSIYIGFKPAFFGGIIDAGAVMNREFGPDDAKQFYDRFGVKQDWQSFCENPAMDDLIAHADFEHAYAIFELGFGTGRLAERLLSRHLPQDASYTGIDISSTMFRIAVERLNPWRRRIKIKVADGTKGLDLHDESFDRFVSAYVLDLLSPDGIRRVIADAYRILKPGGRLCLTSLTRGTTAWGHIVTRAWECVYRRRPQLVGGCRPVELLDYLAPEHWRIVYRNTVSSFGITSEIIIASRMPP